MICAYCGKEAKGTKEHIISSGILGLFPECFATIDGERSIVHQGDPMVKDVCADCNNNRISYIDSYAKEFIEKYFLVKYKKDDTLSVEYDYTMIQKMCLKFAFNDLRARKKDVSFFDDEVKEFLLNEEKSSPLGNITILAGLAVNTSPAPDYMFGNIKLRWGDSPLLLANSIVTNIDYNTGHITLREEMEIQEFENYALSYVFRFNSLQLLILCWDRDIKEDVLNKNNIILKYQYPYSILDASGNTVLSRCTSEATYHHEQLIDVTWGQGLMDEISYMRGTFSEQSEKYFEEVQKRWDRDIKEDVLNKNNIILKYQYPYSILDASGNTVLSRCTSEATYHHEQLIDVTWGQGLMDEISYMRGTFSEQSEKYFEEVQKRWDEEERKLAEEHPR